MRRRIAERYRAVVRDRDNYVVGAVRAAADRDRADRDFALFGAASGLGNRLGHQRQLSFAFDHPEQCYIDKAAAPNREFARIRSSSATAGHPMGIKTVKN